MRGMLPAALLVLGVGGVAFFSHLSGDGPSHRSGDGPPVPPHPMSTPPLGEGLYSSPDRVGRFPRSQFFIEHERFFAADMPGTVPAEEATFLQDDDEVLGYVLGGRARAYPITMISYHHVVNDVLGDVPVAVFY